MLRPSALARALLFTVCLVYAGGSRAAHTRSASVREHIEEHIEGQTTYNPFFLQADIPHWRRIVTPEGEAEVKRLRKRLTFYLHGMRQSESSVHGLSGEEAHLRLRAENIHYQMCEANRAHLVELLATYKQEHPHTLRRFTGRVVRC